MLAAILTYHSHHVLSSVYAENDHVALASDLEAIQRSGTVVIHLDELVDLAVESGRLRRLFHRRTKIVAITFDDGPEYDYRPMLHPILGPFESFAQTLLRFRDRYRQQRQAHATSFVIASPAARAAMESTYDPQYTYVGPGAMNEDWWNDAIDSGLLAIANHSWDHLHPKLDRVAHSRQAKGNFGEVDNEADADVQIADAARYIARATAGRVAPFFAYPFGQRNDFLVESYLPARGAALGLRAALTTEPRLVDSGDNRWTLPRFTCGHHWCSPRELERILG